MTCHITMERISPPLQPVDPLTVAQHNFLALHAAALVTSWQWHFCESQLRAAAGTRKATIWRDELDDLVRWGLMERGTGYSVAVTAMGREAMERTAKETT